MQKILSCRFGRENVFEALLPPVMVQEEHLLVYVERTETKSEEEIRCIWDNFAYYTPAKHSFRGGVYCFQPVRHSVIPSFCDFSF